MKVIIEKIKEIKIFIVASEKPKNLKSTFLQLIELLFSCFNRSSFDKSLLSFSKSQTADSSIKPCSISKWLYDKNVANKNVILS